MSFSLRLTTAVAVATLSLPIAAQDSITLLGSGSAAAVSADGTTVIGNAPGNAVKWLPGGVEVSLGTATAVGVSADGSLAAGNLVDGGGMNTAARHDGVWNAISSLPVAGCGNDLLSAYAMSDDGSVIVGLGWEQCEGRAFMWVDGIGTITLSQLGPGSARANNVSGDGTVIGGWDEASNGPRLASMWHANGTQELILAGVNPANPDGLGEVWGLSTDGTFSCGQSASGLPPFVWSSTTGITETGLLPGGAVFDAARLTAITDDGSMAVGWQGSNFGTPFRGTIWREGHGLQSLLDFAADRGLAIPAALASYGDYALGEAIDMTPDGRTIVGATGDFFFGYNAWRIDLDLAWTGLGHALDGVNGQPLLAGAGDLSAGSAGSVSLANAAPNAASVLFVSIGSTPVPFKGGMLAAVPVIASVGLMTDANGETSLPWASWPAGLGAGTEIVFQQAIADAAAPHNVALSNAIMGTTP